jgi:hypothetical protein
LYYWRQRAVRAERATRRRRRPRRVRLAPVHVMPATEGANEVEILLATGDRVRVSAAVSEATLRRVIEVRAAC